MIFGGLLGLLLLWWLMRPKVVSAPASTVHVSTPTPGVPSASASAPIAGPVATPVIVQPPRPPPLDVAGNVVDGEGDLLKANAGTQVLWWNDSDTIYRQLWLPASKIPLSNLGPEDWIYARTFLENAGGEFTRRDDLGKMGQELLADARQQGGGALAASIIGTVASIIPVIGAGFNAAMQNTASTIAGSGAWNEAMGNGQLGATIRSSLTSPTAQTRHLLANYSDTGDGSRSGQSDGPEGPLDRRVMVMPETIGILPAQSIQPANPIFAATQPGWGRPRQFRIRLRLFTRYAGGWLMPWLCWHFNGDATQSIGMRQTVNARARVLRAVDAICCQYSPYTRENAPYGYASDHSANATFPLGRGPRLSGSGQLSMDQTVFYYTNPLLGPMLGSIFPPTREDSRYVGSDGRTYSFYGEPTRPTSSIAVGPLDDYMVDPSNAGQERRANTGGSSM